MCVREREREGVCVYLYIMNKYTVYIFMLSCHIFKINFNKSSDILIISITPMLRLPSQIHQQYLQN